MPKKGTPRCKCGWDSWWLVRGSESSGLIECKHCFRQVRTQSRSRHRLERIDEAAEEATE